MSDETQPLLTIRVYPDFRARVTQQDKEGQETTWDAAEFHVDVFTPQGGSISLQSDGYTVAKMKQRRRLK